MKIDAILPAGGKISGEFADAVGVCAKALIPINGKSVLERTIEVLRLTRLVGKCVVIGGGEVAGHPASKAADVVLPEVGSGPDNILSGIHWLKEQNGCHSDRVLIITTDLPFLTSQAITSFLERCPPEMDICLPLVSKADFDSSYPGSPNTFVHLNDGDWTMGCAFLVNPAQIELNQKKIERIFQARKSQMAMLRILGLPFVIRFLTKRLTIGHIERRCLQMLNCTGTGIRDCAPELAYDIDSQDEYDFAIHHDPRR